MATNKMEKSTKDNEYIRYSGKILKKLRNQRGWTQKQLADKLNTSDVCIGYWEKGTRKIPHDKLLEIREIFAVSLDEFYPTSEINLTNEQFKDSLRKVLVEKGVLQENEELTDEIYNRLLDFAKANREFIIKK